MNIEEWWQAVAIGICAAVGAAVIGTVLALAEGMI